MDWIVLSVFCLFENNNILGFSFGEIGGTRSVQSIIFLFYIFGKKIARHPLTIDNSFLCPPTIQNDLYLLITLLPQNL